MWVMKDDKWLRWMEEMSEGRWCSGCDFFQETRSDTSRIRHRSEQIVKIPMKKRYARATLFILLIK
jgi:hypothetical protein